MHIFFLPAKNMHLLVFFLFKVNLSFKSTGEGTFLVRCVTNQLSQKTAGHQKLPLLDPISSAEGFFYW